MTAMTANTINTIIQGFIPLFLLCEKIMWASEHTMPVYEHSNIDFGKTQTHFSAIQAILWSKIIRISKIGAPDPFFYQTSMVK